MGLDMYLYESIYLGGWDHRKGTPGYELTHELIDKLDIPADAGGGPHLEVRGTVAYWRKANAVHQWFVNTCQSGIDDCRYADVDGTQLDELVKLCRTVVDGRDNPEATALAITNLAPQSGFFFGSTEVDEWYYKDLEYTVDTIAALRRRDARDQRTRDRLRAQVRAGAMTQAEANQEWPLSRSYEYHSSW